MKYYGIYYDGDKIASGAFGDVYAIPFENGKIGVVTVVSGDSARKYLAKERLVKLVNTNQTLSYAANFDIRDVENLVTESELNAVSLQGGWSLVTNDADGTYTAYGKPFTGNRIVNNDILTDKSFQVAVIAAVAASSQKQTKKHTGLRAIWNQLTGW